MKSCYHVILGIADNAKEIGRARGQMEENEQLPILIKGLRGQNLKDVHSLLMTTSSFD